MTEKIIVKMPTEQVQDIRDELQNVRTATNVLQELVKGIKAVDAEESTGFCFWRLMTTEERIALSVLTGYTIPLTKDGKENSQKSDLK